MTNPEPLFIHPEWHELDRQAQLKHVLETAPKLAELHAESEASFQAARRKAAESWLNKYLANHENQG